MSDRSSRLRFLFCTHLIGAVPLLDRRQRTLSVDSVLCVASSGKSDHTISGTFGKSFPKLLLVSFTFLVFFVSQWAKSADNRPPLVLNGVKLGEGLGKFKSRFPHVHCRRRPNGGVEESALRREWMEWIDCAADQAPLDERDPLGTVKASTEMNATFQNEKLILLQYYVEGERLTSILNAFAKRYGPPDKTSLLNDGLSKYASWTYGDSELEIEQIEVYGLTEGTGFIRIEKQWTRSGVRITLLPLPKPGE